VEINRILCELGTDTLCVCVCVYIYMYIYILFGYKVTLEQVFLWVLRRFPRQIIPPVLHAHFHVLVARTGRANGQSLGTFQKVMHFRKSGGI
jgi:hypothetical protein